MPRALAKSVDAQTADTLSERAAALIQRDILTGRLPPGSRLGIMDLAQGYGMGATPVREGLSRLAARQLVIALGQRGFRVAPVSETDLRDITRMRIIVEQEALCLSMKQGKDDWEAGIVAALHRMQRYVERTGSKFTEGAEEFDTLHKRFHTSLLEACGSPRLLAAHSDLYDQAYRYRRVMMRKFESGKTFVQAHRDLADCVLARDQRRAPAMLEAHLKSTIGYVYPDEKGQKS
ncbi:FCD domain-containing protein [Bradyrhizobium sp. LHD-71]|uniref:GntR family transcriptional regulator n=1 Tax=Bradyrhizobium sp. LHD-71 TaxID=3072141 RepID=UPI00280DA7DE|nr:FCD domain-containing protein [Bradyrhizobium sp. LHD-71]MDQ8731408.1 FCD domain-containing protein [Bradyrhizobium sp. LHD-71]